MNQILTGSIALLLTAILWTLNKEIIQNLVKQSQKNPFLSNTGISSELVQIRKNSALEDVQSMNANWESPKNTRERINFKKELMKLMQGNPDDRFKAVILASHWDDSRRVPILILGLKDVDSRVVETSAKAMDSKLKVRRVKPSQDKLRPPRNVFLMR